MDIRGFGKFPLLILLAVFLAVGPAFMSRLVGNVGATDGKPAATLTDAAGEKGKSYAKKGKEEEARRLPFGVKDKGVFSDLDAGVSMGLPAGLNKDNASLRVNKKKRTLSLFFGDVPVKTYPIALGFTPSGDKEVEGDGKTPEGEYSICEMRHKDLPAKYGARSILLAYPGAKDAKRGLKQGIITKEQHDKIMAAQQSGAIPPQDTVLGSSIRIHGGGAGEDWTAGCIGLRDEDAVEIYGSVKVGTPVIIESGIQKDPHDADGDGIPDQVDILAGALKCAINSASFDTGYVKIAYPMGDVARDKGCCTDVIIRALRNAGIDLQKDIYKDIKKRKKAYKHIKKPNTDIDHRRVRNMIVYMKKRFEPITTKLEKEQLASWLPGDIVYFDTMSKAGPDHVGIVSFNADENGIPMVIDNWYWGSTTKESDLLSWCPVTHHFRLK